MKYDKNLLKEYQEEKFNILKQINETYDYIKQSVFYKETMVDIKDPRERQMVWGYLRQVPALKYHFAKIDSLNEEYSKVSSIINSMKTEFTVIYTTDEHQSKKAYIKAFTKEDAYGSLFKKYPSSHISRIVGCLEEPENIKIHEMEYAL